METESNAPADARAVVDSLFEPFGLALPADARDFTVDRSPLEPFQNASLTTFTADSAEMTAACESAGAMVAPDARIVAQDAKLLRGVHLEEGSTLCSKDSDYGRGPAFRAVIPPSKTGTVYVAVYQLPAGR
ncbi:hypothetical protein [Arthrobacter cupressi]|uniref:Uncharacterized protein n=1 Tax=Arthrobacter cupressi TaxID=1045773 RepID=A0A1G8MTZ6_9MICC|nr:hypothetical protein [Arthrobacter cupressi]NYD76932.1 hypothetical protein [Arthrobacter cupressi]SDI71275.1 hypothetical protein SAMN05216555_10436 [Arthrobacter cupressi]